MPLLPPPRESGPPRASPPSARSCGFTLIELVIVVVVVGAIAAMALPRYLELGRAARVALVNTLAANLRSAAVNFHVTCKLDPGCDYNASWQPAVTIGGKSYGAVYGWPNAGGNHPAEQEVPGLVNFSGFHVVTGGYQTYDTGFTLDGAPDSARCLVTYTTPYLLGPAAIPPVVAYTSGC